MNTLVSDFPAKPGHHTLSSVAVRRHRVSLVATALLLAGYLAFICLVAFDKQALVAQVVPGLSWALVAGLVTFAYILLLTFGYVTWVGRIHDRQVRTLRGQGAHHE